MLALELRQLGGAFATPAANGGALDHLEAPLLLYAVGPAGDQTIQDLAAVRAAAAPYLTGFTAPNFIELFGQPQRTFGHDTQARAERVRRDTDPTGLFADDATTTLDGP